MNNLYFSFSAFLSSFPKLLIYLPYTLGVVIIILTVSLILALFITFLRLRHNTIISGITRAYITLMRGIPLMLLLFLVYYGVPLLLRPLGMNLSDTAPIIFVIIAFTLSTSSFCAEVMRSAYEAIDKGQLEAADSLNLPRVVKFIRIIFPQAFILALPNIGNLIITVIKQSSIMYTIGVMDIYQKARTLSADHFGVWQLEIFLALLLIYWGIAVLIDKGLDILYKKTLLYIP